MVDDIELINQLTANAIELKNRGDCAFIKTITESAIKHCQNHDWMMACDRLSIAEAHLIERLNAVAGVKK